MVVASQNYCNDHTEYLSKVLGVIVGTRGTESGYSAGDDGSDGAPNQVPGEILQSELMN